MVKTSLREQHAQATRRALLRAARRQFVRHGYAAAGVDEIAEAAGATRGALYHHFQGKQELFRAVFEELEQELAQRVGVAAEGLESPWDAFRTSVSAFFEACLDPALRRIAFQEAPAVLGWETFREIDAQYFLGGVTLTLETLMEAGVLRRHDLRVLAHLVLGSLTEAAMLIAASADPRATRREAEKAFWSFMEGLRRERTR